MDQKNYTWWKKIGIILLAYSIHLVFTMDHIAWKHTNRLSQWLQKAFVISKWWLAAISLTIGISLQVHPERLWSILLPVLYGMTIVQVVKEAGKHSDESEALDLESLKLITSTRWIRVVFLLVNLLVPSYVYHIMEDFDAYHALWDTINTFGIFLATLGFYFVDSTYIPPGGRRLLNFSKKHAQERS